MHLIFCVGTYLPYVDVQEKGLEPSRLSAPDPKSGASAIPPLLQDCHDSNAREVHAITNRGVEEGLVFTQIFSRLTCVQVFTCVETDGLEPPTSCL